ncbi:MAG: hypothetical protein IBJ00_02460 [Alphaproteobacteria bacterium]|nr:hypothetical protein [Alphaproteobacteria bacterium]
MSETDLKLSCGGLPPWSARGCTQILRPIPTGDLRRTVNGQLIYTGLQSHQKYQSLIQCEDKTPIALDGLWRGNEIEVSCIQPLTQRMTGQVCRLDRKPIIETVQAIENRGQPLVIADIEGQDVRLASSIQQGFITYCPILQMRIVDFGYNIDEWGLKNGWYLKLEEI